MIAYFSRLAKRLAVLIPGIVISIFAVRDVYPIFEKRLPVSLALFTTYIVTAYGLIPAAMRLLRTFLKPQHIPIYATTPDGFASDPVNIGVIGTRDELVAAITSAGWRQADHRSLPNVLRMVLAIALKKPYPSAPFSSLYLFGRSQDIGFQKAITKSPRKRHHVRFWAATYTTDPRYRDHVFFWQKHHHSPTAARVLWVGAASRDIGLGLIRHNAQITHMVHEDTNAERDLIVRDLKRAGKIKATRTINVGKPYKLPNRVWGGSMVSDGGLVICELKA